jgi:malonyl-CoA/methylmalonyl-CoA synthetase
MIPELQKRLAKVKVPKRTTVIPELHRNAMGKVQKCLLRQTYAGFYES